MRRNGSFLRLAAGMCSLLVTLTACSVYAGVIDFSGDRLPGPSPARVMREAPTPGVLEILDEPMPEGLEYWVMPRPGGRTGPLAAPPPPPPDRPPFYIEANTQRYRDFMREHPEIPYETAIAYVNAGVDISHDTAPVRIQHPDSILVMPTKRYALSPHYSPDDLVSIPARRPALLRRDAAERFIEMYNDMRAAGLRIFPISAYRGYARQRAIHERYAARAGRARAEMFSARPGHSEHQTGLAVDILHRLGDRTMGAARFQNTRQYAWLLENAHRYGFILRYPAGYEHITGYMYEPWHWRYIGTEAATHMKTEGITTFEEFFGRYVAPGSNIQPSVTQNGAQ